MADITMCTQKLCPNAEHCLRVQARPAILWQSWATFNYTISLSGVACDNYMPMYRTEAAGSTTTEEADMTHFHFQGIELTTTRPTIITLCGSSRFCAEMAILAWEFEKGGAIALGLHLLPHDYCVEQGMIPDADGNIHHIGEQEGVEQQMDALHFKKIEMADSIFIVNIGGYIGSSTAREIAYAKHLGKRISYLEDVQIPPTDKKGS